MTLIILATLATLAKHNFPPTAGQGVTTVTGQLQLAGDLLMLLGRVSAARRRRRAEGVLTIKVALHMRLSLAAGTRQDPANVRCPAF